MIEPYDGLAAIYDHWQQDYDPAAWADYLVKLDRVFQKRTGPGDGRAGRPLLLDLGCGTGRICLEMTRRGYDCIGIDASAAMLAQADKNWQASTGPDPDKQETRPLFLQQPMHRFELYGTVDLIVCLLDTVNHLTRRADVQQFLHQCALYLNPGGLLIFDLATRHHLAEVLGNRLFCQDTESYTLLWQNRYQSRYGISSSDLTLFLAGSRDQYTRHDIRIRERYYSAADIADWLRPLPLACLGCYNPLTMRQASEKATRHFYVIRRLAGSISIKTRR